MQQGVEIVLVMVWTNQCIREAFIEGIIQIDVGDALAKIYIILLITSKKLTLMLESMRVGAPPST